MDNSNEKLILRLRGIAENLPKITDIAGELLVQNVRKQATEKFGKDMEWPHEISHSFQNNDTVYYRSGDKAVYVDHPAAFRLEYGLLKPLVIESKSKDKPLRYIGRDGEVVFTHKVTIRNSKPYGYARAAIKDTSTEIATKFREVTK